MLLQNLPCSFRESPCIAEQRDACESIAHAHERRVPASKHQVTCASPGVFLSCGGSHLMKVEKVQKFACKLATSRWDSSYDELLSLLDMTSLQDRRLELKLGLMFKLVHKLCFFPEDSWSFRDSCRCTRNSNSLQLLRPLAHTNAYKHSFFPGTAATWNQLDDIAVTATSYRSFMQLISN